MNDANFLGKSAPSKLRPASGVWVGVEIGPTVVRAAAFSSAFELLGKMKLGAKSERGWPAVLDRLERCARYVVDDCDLDFRSVRGVGVGVPGLVRAETGMASLQPDIDWPPFALRSEMEQRLGCPVTAGNAFVFATQAVHAFDASIEGQDAGVVFPGSTLGAGLILGGEVQDLSRFPARQPLLPANAASVVSRSDDPKFQPFRARDFRKAIRKGNADATTFIRDSVTEAATFAARLIRASGVSRLVLAGGAIDENRSAMLEVAREALSANLGEDAAGVKVYASALGDLGPLLGAALCVERTLTAGRVAVVNERGGVPAR